MIASCPECGAPGVPLMFGLPAPEAQRAAAEGDLALGGCVVSADSPNWECPRGHRWRDTDERAWDRRLVAVLQAHGYREAGD